MSKTIRRRGIENTRNQSWHRQGRKTNGVYTTWDIAVTNGNGHAGAKLFRPMTDREIHEERKWMHGESKHNNARGPNWLYKRRINRKFRTTEKMELRRELMNPEYDGVYFATKPAWWSWQFW